MTRYRNIHFRAQLKVDARNDTDIINGQFIFCLNDQEYIWIKNPKPVLQRQILIGQSKIETKINVKQFFEQKNLSVILCVLYFFFLKKNSFSTEKVFHFKPECDLRSLPRPKRPNIYAKHVFSKFPLLNKNYFFWKNSHVNHYSKQF